MDNEFYINAIEKNLFKLSLSLGNVQGGCIYDGEDFKWAYTGGLAVNRIFPLKLNEVGLGEELLDVITRFKAWDVPFNVLLCPSTYPKDIDRYLIDYELVFSRKWSGMALNLHGFCPEVKKTPDIEIVKVDDVEKLKTWGKTAGECFGAFGKMLIDMENLFVKLDLMADNNIFYYLALKNGMPVATCCLFKDGGTGGLYWVGTLPEARGEGIATALVVHVLKEAISMGCSVSILQASDMGKGVYEKIGFKEYCTIDIYRNAD